MSYLLGIDLGATAVTAAVQRDGRTTVHALPAVLVATPAGDLLCGAPAHRRAPADPGRVARGFLERVGDPTPLSLGGVAHHAEDLCARIVRYLVDDVAARHGAPPSRIGVTHPASWGRHKRDLLAAALARYGLTVSLVAAPQAVALAHSAHGSHSAHGAGTPGARPLAVVDLGGTGTTVTVLDPAGPGVLPAVARGPVGCRSGGADVDDAVFAFVRAATPELAAAVDALDPDDPAVLAALTALRDDCRAAKERLSEDTVTTVRVDLPGVRTSVRIHRSDLDELAGPLLEPVADPVADALAAVPQADVLLAGGAARMPVTVQVLSAALGRPVTVAADPVHDAARGAAMAVAPGAGAVRPGGSLPAGPVATGAPPRIPAPRGPARADAAHRDAVHRDPAHREPAHRDAAHRDPAHRDPAHREPAHRDPAPSAPHRSPDGPASIPAARSAPVPIPAAAPPGDGPAAGRSARTGTVALLDPPPARRTGPGTARIDRLDRLDRAPAVAAPQVPTPAAGRAARPERPAPDSLVTRDTAGPCRPRATRQRLLLGSGALAGVAAVAGVLLLWPSQASFGELSAAPTLPAVPVPAPAPVVPGAQAPTTTAAVPSAGTDVSAGGPATATARTGAGTAAPAQPVAGVPTPAAAGPAVAPVVPPAAPVVPPAPVPTVPAGGPTTTAPATGGSTDVPSTDGGAAEEEPATPPTTGGTTTTPAAPGVTTPVPPPAGVAS